MFPFEVSEIACGLAELPEGAVLLGEVSLRTSNCTLSGTDGGQGNEPPLLPSICHHVVLKYFSSC